MSESLYTPNAQAGYRDGLSGKVAQIESEACKNSRFGYFFGYVQGARRRREEIAAAQTETPEERARRFFAAW